MRVCGAVGRVTAATSDSSDGLELPGQEALDHGQGEAPLLEVVDAAQPLEVARRRTR